MTVRENVPLGDALLVATVLDNRIPIVSTNDKYVEKTRREIWFSDRKSDTGGRYKTDEMGKTLENSAGFWK
ncbi:hypothetical protein DRO58_04490 [Candidatus Bathyarchaeota archaeon]|nr:MAG: hypothetical protein DRO58_04490 [Candidatus Bathyarchaeota archaeon]